MVQLEQYDASPSVSVEMEANGEVNIPIIIPDYLLVWKAFDVFRIIWDLFEGEKVLSQQTVSPYMSPKKCVQGESRSQNSKDGSLKILNAANDYWSIEKCYQNNSIASIVLLLSCPWRAFYFCFLSTE